MSSQVLGLADCVRAWPEKPAFYEGERVVTYGEFGARVQRGARVLEARGVEAGDRVAIMLPNSITFFEVWAAAGELGASVVLVNSHLKRDELDYILRDSNAKVLVDDLDEYEQSVAAVEAEDVVDAPPLSAPVLAAPVFYTSGTTGRPKGVIHGAFDGDRAQLAQRGQVALWGWSPDDVYILSGPAYHAGPGGFVMSALFVGATSVILPAWDAREWLRLVERHRVTLSFMTPAHFIRILEIPQDERARFDLSSLRLVVHGGAPCPVPVKRRIIEAFASTEVWELYGASEGGATRISPQEWLARPGSVGVPWPGVDVRILDADGHVLGSGETGLIYIAPAGGARFHYHDDPDKTAQAWRDGAFTVGDIGYLDDDRYLFLTDRASDMVIRRGVNIYPREIEDVLYLHPAVVDCAVFGVPDERDGESLKAVVELRSAVSPDDLRSHVVASLADYKVPKHIEIV
ncbi:MAG: long-chain acyl-CoA synthetase, partial [Actinomycetota bacterium]|nr:long-chain acyl-CoA synthetase [Actinomycetota bacterium]